MAHIDTSAQFSDFPHPTPVPEPTIIVGDRGEGMGRMEMAPPPGGSVTPDPWPGLARGACESVEMDKPGPVRPALADADAGECALAHGKAEKPMGIHPVDKNVDGTARGEGTLSPRI